MPRTKSSKHAHGAESKPLHALIGALVGVPQLLLTRTEVFHLGNDIANHLLDTAEVSLNGLELLLGLDAGPVTGIGADLNIEFDLTEGIGSGVYILGCISGD